MVRNRLWIFMRKKTILDCVEHRLGLGNTYTGSRNAHLKVPFNLLQVECIVSIAKCKCKRKRETDGHSE